MDKKCKVISGLKTSLAVKTEISYHTRYGNAREQQ